MVNPSFMDKLLPRVVVIRDAQLGMPVPRDDLSFLCCQAHRTLMGQHECLECPADVLEFTGQACARLRWCLPCQIRQPDQPVQAGAQSVIILCHDPANSTAAGGS